MRQQTKRKRQQSKRQREQGLVSVFLAGILALTTISVGAFNDVQMLTAAKAETRSALRLSSHMALARFSKPLAKEYGLFAIPNLEADKGEALAAMEERINLGPGREDLLAMSLESVTVEGKEGERLSRPEVMEGQIVQFMDWQLPRLAFSSLMLNFGFYDQLKAAVPALQARLNYEEKLEGVQKKLDQIGDQVEKLADLKYADLFPGGEAYDRENAFACLPSLSTLAEPLYKDFDQLSHHIQAADQALSQLEPGSEAYQAGEDQARKALGAELKAMQDYQQKVSKHLGQVDKGAAGMIKAIGQAKDSVAGLDGSAAAWKSCLDQLGPGELAASLKGDYYAQAGRTNLGAVKDLEEEMGKIQDKAQEMQAAWDELSMGGILFSSLTVDDLLSLGKSLKLKDVEGMEIDKEAEKTQETLNLNREDKRSGFLEFIKAWKSKREVIANARKAKKMGTPALRGNLSSRVGSGAMARFTADHLGSSSSSAPGSVSFFNERTMLRDSMTKLEGVMASPSDLSLLEEGTAAAKVMTYWAGMFSCRTTPLIEQDQGKEVKSLVGLPLNERPYFGGEQEYILFGQDRLVDNLDRAAWQIFAVRLLANMIYAFSSPDLQMETSSLALALAGWTGFAVPFVQSALLSVLACGESFLDLQALLDGQDLPVFKDASNWRFSLTGVRGLAGDLTANLFEEIDGQVISGSRALSSLLQERCQTMGDGVKESMANDLKKPVARFMLDAVMAVTEKEEDLQLEAKFDELIASLQASQPDTGPGRAAQQALSELASYKGAVVGKTKELIAARKESGGKTAGTAEEITDFVDGLADPITGRISQAIDEVEKKWEGKAGQLNDLAEDKVDQAVGDWLEGFQGELTGSSPTGLTAGKGAGLNMGYDDYIKMFLAMKAASPSTRMDGLSNTGKLIQAERGDIDLTTAPTALSWQAEVQVKTPFLPHLEITSFAEARTGGSRVKESWEEGYGKQRKKE